MTADTLQDTLDLYGYLPCTFTPEDGDECDDCGVVPITLYAQVDYFGETNDYLCANCVLKKKYRDDQRTEKFIQHKEATNDR